MSALKFNITDALAPCPRCLTKETLELIQVNWIALASSYAIRCSCNLVGPSRRTIEKAIAAWNVATTKPMAEPIGCECSGLDHPTEPATPESRAIRHVNR